MKKAFASVEILIVILIIAVVGVVAFILGNNPSTPEETFSPAPTSTSNPEAMMEDEDQMAIEEMSDWKAYSNNSLGINFKAPNSLITCTKSTYISIRTVEECDSSGAPGNDMSVHIITQEKDLFVYLSDLAVGGKKEGQTEGQRLANVTYERVSNSQIGGLVSKNYIQTSTFSIENEIFQSFSFIERDNTTYQITRTYLKSYPNIYNIEFKKVFDTILHTFEFTR